MTIRFGRPVLEYKPAGMVENGEGEVEYEYQPVEETVWYTAETILGHDRTELESVKVLA
jgi:hypothetical protein